MPAPLALIVPAAAMFPFVTRFDVPKLAGPSYRRLTGLPAAAPAKATPTMHVPLLTLLLNCVPHPRGLDRKLMRTLANSEWVRQHQNILLIGPTGIGKTWLGCALAQKACRDGFSVLHKRTTELFRELAVAHVDGSIGRVLQKLSRVDVLVMDDFAMAPLKDSERRDILEICDDRYQRRSMILTSQLSTAHWHEQIGDPTVADSILDRVVHNAYRVELNGESIRKVRGRKPREEQPQ